MGSLPFDTMVESLMYVLLVFVHLHVSCFSWWCIFLSHFILDMSNSKQPSIAKALDVIVCRNLFCSHGQKASVCNRRCVAKTFGCAKAMHVILDESQQSGQWAFQQQQRTSVTIGCAQGIVNTSYKRKCVLRCDVVNDINPACLHTDYEPDPRQGRSCGFTIWSKCCHNRCRG